MIKSIKYFYNGMERAENVEENNINIITELSNNLETNYEAKINKIINLRNQLIFIKHKHTAQQKNINFMLQVHEKNAKYGEIYVYNKNKIYTFLHSNKNYFFYWNGEKINTKNITESKLTKAYEIFQKNKILTLYSEITKEQKKINEPVYYSYRYSGEKYYTDQPNKVKLSPIIIKNIKKEIKEFIGFLRFNHQNFILNIFAKGFFQEFFNYLLTNNTDIFILNENNELDEETFESNQNLAIEIKKTLNQLNIINLIDILLDSLSKEHEMIIEPIYIYK